MAANQFEILGVDVRDYGRLWVAAWKDLLFGQDSPLRALLDPTVNLMVGDGTTKTYQAGREIANEASAPVAAALPEELVLARRLTLPTIAETDLDAAIGLEVSASSPFAADDTVSGWHINRADKHDSLLISLVITSRSAAVQHLSQQYDSINPEEMEIWGKCDDKWVVLRGFGESAREAVYRKNLLTVGGFSIAVLLLLLVFAGVSTAVSGWRLEQLKTAQTDTAREAQTALRMRDEIATVNATILELNKLSRQLPSPQVELARLTDLLPDSAYLVQYTQNGRKIRVRGRAADAASLQQLLTEQEIYESVTAPQAISRVGNTSEEQFFLDLELSRTR